MRSRAYRRHKRAVKLARRYRIVQNTVSGYENPPTDPRARHWHINCHCFAALEPSRSKLARRQGRADLDAQIL